MMEVILEQPRLHKVLKKRAYYAVLAYFWCPVVTLITFSSNPMVTLKEIQKKYKKSKKKFEENLTYFRNLNEQSLHKRKSLCLILEELFIEVFVEQPLALPWTNTMSIIDRQEIHQE